MKDIAIFKTIHIDESAGVHLQQYVLDSKPADLYKLDFIDFGVFQFSKYIDADMLTLQFSPEVLDGLCDAWIAHRQNHQKQQSEVTTQYAI
ncbi:hypothetical protein [Rheinheimera aquimaris]|uniref:hypothetical protein n=1 Tax=Rheinheimera aquimaris TaxID=412437 RepID=UPI0010646913|nr:hypothetical protein [Rheinheimera aquimaris]